MAGYSGTPLAKKLGITPGMRVVVRRVPDAYREWIAPLGDEITFQTRVSVTTDLLHIFTDSRRTLDKELQDARKILRPDAMVWVSWPKKASRVATDITEDTVRELALPLGFVDVKVCAVSEVWSGLKLVVRKALRTP